MLRICDFVNVIDGLFLFDSYDMFVICGLLKFFELKVFFYKIICEINVNGRCDCNN